MNALVKQAAVAVAAVFVAFQLPVIGDAMRKAAQKPAA